jgi:hypothetical protein
VAFASLFLGRGLDAEVNADSPVLRFFTPKMAFLARHHALAIGHCHPFDPPNKFGRTSASLGSRHEEISRWPLVTRIEALAVCY